MHDLPRYPEDEPAHGRRTPAAEAEEQRELDWMLEEFLEEQRALRWLTEVPDA